MGPRPSAVTEAQLWVSELTMNVAVTIFIGVVTVLVMVFFGIWKFRTKVLPSHAEAPRKYRFRKRDKVMFFGRKMLRKVKSFTRNTVGPGSSTGMRRKPSNRLMISRLRRFLAERNKDNNKPRLKQQSPPQSFLEADWSDIGDDHRLPPEVLYMLRSVRVFGHLEKPFFLELCRFMETITLRSGNYLFKIGDPDDSIYVVQNGLLEVFITDSDGTEHLVKEVATGNSIHSLLSILDVLTGHPGTFRSVSARAVTDSTILRLPAHAFKSMFEKFNESAVKVVQIIMVRLQRVTFSALHNYLGLSKELLKPEGGQADVKELNIHRLNRQPSTSSSGSPTKTAGSSTAGGQQSTTTDQPGGPPEGAEAPSSARAAARDPGSTEDGEERFHTPPNFNTAPRKSNASMLMGETSEQLSDFDQALMRARVSVTDEKSIVLSGSPPRTIRWPSDPSGNAATFRGRHLPDENNILTLAAKDLVQILGLKDPTLLKDKLTLKKVRAGTIFCKQGDQDTSLFFLVKGTVSVLQNVVGESSKEALMHQVEPGEIIDVLAVLTGEPSFFTLRGKTDAIMVVISKLDFYQIMRSEPFIVLNVAHQTVKRMSNFVRQIDFALDWQMLEAGKALFRQGDTSDSIFIVLTGRLRSVITSAGGKKELVNEFGRGELVGIVEVLTQNERATTVLAIRDTEVTKLPSELLSLIKLRYPQVVARLIHLLGTRILGSLQQRNNINLQASVSLDNDVKMERSTVANLATIAIVPVTEDVPLTNFALELQHALLAIGPTVRLTPDIVRARLGTAALDGVNEFRLFNWLSQQEDIHRMVLYQCDHQLTKWSKHCLRQADCILIVALADKDPTIGPIEKELENIAVRAQKELVLLHREDAETPRNTAEWLNARGWLSSHHHLRCPKRVLKAKSPSKTLELYEKLFDNPPDRMADFSRLARFLTGTSIGLVLGGGGARGLAHVGMIKAMTEEGIPIDMVGGTSMGAFIGALWAEERQYVPFTRRAREWAMGMTSLWKKLWDLTYPVTSMFTGWAFNESIENVFRDRQIEDLWIPYFCITTNISNSSMRVHSLGSVWRYVRASMSLSGYLPPLCDPGDGHLLLDGGYVNNLPADVMHQLGANFVFAVDVGSQDEKDHTNYGDSLSGWWLLWKRWNPWAEPVKVPDMTEIQSRLAYVSCVRQLELVKNSDYCEYIRPPIDRYATLQFGAYDEIMETGYHHGKTLFSTWTKGGLSDKLFVESLASSPTQEPGGKPVKDQLRSQVPVMAYFTDLAEQVSRIDQVKSKFFAPDGSEDDIFDEVDDDEGEDPSALMDGYEEDDEFAGSDEEYDDEEYEDEEDNDDAVADGNNEGADKVSERRKVGVVSALSNLEDGTGDGVCGGSSPRVSGGVRSSTGLVTHVAETSAEIATVSSEFLRGKEDDGGSVVAQVGVQNPGFPEHIEHAGHNNGLQVTTVEPAVPDAHENAGKENVGVDIKEKPSKRRLVDQSPRVSVRENGLALAQNGRDSLTTALGNTLVLSNQENTVGISEPNQVASDVRNLKDSALLEKNLSTCRLSPDDQAKPSRGLKCPFKLLETTRGTAPPHAAACEDRSSGGSKEGSTPSASLRHPSLGIDNGREAGKGPEIVESDSSVGEQAAPKPHQTGEGGEVVRLEQPTVISNHHQACSVVCTSAAEERDGSSAVDSDKVWTSLGLGKASPCPAVASPAAPIIELGSHVKWSEDVQRDLSTTEACEARDLLDSLDLSLNQMPEVVNLQTLCKKALVREAFLDRSRGVVHTLSKAQSLDAVEQGCRGNRPEGEFSQANSIEELSADERHSVVFLGQSDKKLHTVEHACSQRAESQSLPRSVTLDKLENAWLLNTPVLEHVSPERKWKSISPKRKQESISPERKQESISQEIKQEPVSSERKRESISQKSKQESISQEGKQESISPERKQEPISPERKRESISQESKQESISPERKQKPMSTERKHESISTERKQEFLSPDSKQEPISTERKQVPTSPERKKQSISPETKQVPLSFETDFTHSASKAGENILSNRTKESVDIQQKISMLNKPQETVPFKNAQGILPPGRLCKAPVSESQSKVSTFHTLPQVPSANESSEIHSCQKPLEILPVKQPPEVLPGELKKGFTLPEKLKETTSPNERQKTLSLSKLNKISPLLKPRSAQLPVSLPSEQESKNSGISADKKIKAFPSKRNEAFAPGENVTMQPLEEARRRKVLVKPSVDESPHLASFKQSLEAVLLDKQYKALLLEREHNRDSSHKETDLASSSNTPHKTLSPDGVNNKSLTPIAGVGDSAPAAASQELSLPCGRLNTHDTCLEELRETAEANTAHIQMPQQGGSGAAMMKQGGKTITNRDKWKGHSTEAQSQPVDCKTHREVEAGSGLVSSLQQHMGGKSEQSMRQDKPSVSGGVGQQCQRSEQDIGGKSEQSMGQDKPSVSGGVGHQCQRSEQDIRVELEHHLKLRLRGTLGSESNSLSEEEEGSSCTGKYETAAQSKPVNCGLANDEGRTTLVGSRVRPSLKPSHGAEGGRENKLAPENVECTLEMEKTSASKVSDSGLQEGGSLSHVTSTSQESEKGYDSGASPGERPATLSRSEIHRIIFESDSDTDLHILGVAEKASLLRYYRLLSHHGASAGSSLGDRSDQETFHGGVGETGTAVELEAPHCHSVQDPCVSVGDQGENSTTRRCGSSGRGDRQACVDYKSSEVVAADCRPEQGSLCRQGSESAGQDDVSQPVLSRASVEMVGKRDRKVKASPSSKMDRHVSLHRIIEVRPFKHKQKQVKTATSCLEYDNRMESDDTSNSFSMDSSQRTRSSGCKKAKRGSRTVSASGMHRESSTTGSNLGETKEKGAEGKGHGRSRLQRGAVQRAESENVGLKWTCRFRASSEWVENDRKPDTAADRRVSGGSRDPIVRQGRPRKEASEGTAKRSKVNSQSSSWGLESTRDVSLGQESGMDEQGGAELAKGGGGGGSGVAATAGRGRLEPDGGEGGAGAGGRGGVAVGATRGGRGKKRLELDRGGGAGRGSDTAATGVTADGGRGSGPLCRAHSDLRAAAWRERQRARAGMGSSRRSGTAPPGAGIPTPAVHGEADAPSSLSSPSVPHRRRRRASAVGGRITSATSWCPSTSGQASPVVAEVKGQSENGVGPSTLPGLSHRRSRSVDVQSGNPGVDLPPVLISPLPHVSRGT